MTKLRSKEDRLRDHTMQELLDQANLLAITRPSKGSTTNLPANHISQPGALVNRLTADKKAALKMLTAENLQAPIR